MNRARITLALLAGILMNLTTALGTDSETAECYTDSSCESRCCNYAEEYKVAGSCVPIEDWPRCVDRKKHHRIALYCFLSAMIVIVVVCTMMKKKEVAIKR